MNSLLKHIEREVKRLKTVTDDNTQQLYDVVLVFDRNEAEMKKLIGYPAFAKALEELGGKRDEETIAEACRRSHFHRDSVIFGNEETEEFHIKIPMTRRQAVIMSQKQH